MRTCLIDERQEAYIWELHRSGMTYEDISERLGYSVSAVGMACRRHNKKMKGKPEMPTFLERCKMFYRKEGYTYERDFPGEYYLMTNPKTVKRVRLYYESGKVWEYT